MPAQADLVPAIADAILVGMARTRQAPADLARQGWIVKRAMWYIGRGKLPTLRGLLHLSAAVGWRVVLEISQKPAKQPAPRLTTTAAVWLQAHNDPLLRRLCAIARPPSQQASPPIITPPSDPDQKAATALHHAWTAIGHALGVGLLRTGWSMSTLAQRSGIPRASLYQFIDRTQNPSLANLSSIISSLGFQMTIRSMPASASVPRPATFLDTQAITALHRHRHGVAILELVRRVAPDLPVWPSDDAIIAAYSRKQSYRGTARLLGVSENWLTRRVKALGLPKPPRRYYPPLPTDKRRRRITSMLAAFRAGGSNRAIAAQHGITAQRVSQILLSQGCTNNRRMKELQAQLKRTIAARSSAWCAGPPDLNAIVAELRTTTPLPGTTIRAQLPVARLQQAWKRRERQRQQVMAGRLRSALAERGITQVGLAKALGISRGVPNHIINGYTQGSRVLPRIAAYLGVSEAWLRGEKLSPH